MATLVLTVSGTDRAGLVSALAEVIAANGGNWEQSQMAELAGTFAGIVTVTVADDDVDRLTEALAPLHGLLDVTARRADPAPAAASGKRFSLELVGDDRPGIVHEITAVLARHGVSVERLHTATREAPMSGGALFEARADLVVPATADAEALQRDLEQLANELMVELKVAAPD